LSHVSSVCLVRHRHVPSLPTRRSSDLTVAGGRLGGRGRRAAPVSMSATSYLRNLAGSRVRMRPSLSHPSSGARQAAWTPRNTARSEEHTSELQSRVDLVCRLLLQEKKT